MFYSHKLSKNPQVPVCTRMCCTEDSLSGAIFYQCLSLFLHHFDPPAFKTGGVPLSLTDRGHTAGHGCHSLRVQEGEAGDQPQCDQSGPVFTGMQRGIALSARTMQGLLYCNRRAA